MPRYYNWLTDGVSVSCMSVRFLIIAMMAVCAKFSRTDACLLLSLDRWSPDILVLRLCAVVEATALVADAGDVLVMFGVSSGD